MGYTNFAVNDAFAVKLWAKKLALEALKFTDIGPLIGKADDPSAVIHRKDEMMKGKGDQVTFGLQLQLSGDGFTENELSEGNGESLTIYSDSIVINELGHVVGVKSENTIDDQRVPFSMRDQARKGLLDWWAARYSKSFFNQVCGYTAETRIKYTGLQAAVAPTTTAGSLRQLWQSSRTADEQITSADTFSLTLLDKAKEMATTATPLVRPIDVKGEGAKGVGDYENVMKGMYVVYLHPYQVEDLRTSTSQGQWLDIQKAAMTGGEITKNPIFTGALGVYNNVILRPSTDVTQGVNSSTGAAITTVRRAVMLGAQAATMGFGGREYGGVDKFRWNEELFDHKRRLEVSAWSIFGLKKTRFNSVDFGSIVVSTYAAAHT